MKIVAIIFGAVLVVLWQRPTPQQSATHNVTQDGGADQKAANNTVTPNAHDAAAKNAEKGTEKADADDGEAIRIVPTSKIQTESKKDGFDKVLVFATCLLVIVGGVQIFYLWGTVLAANNNAEAARLNAQSVINSERPWMFIEIKTSESKEEGVPKHMGFSVSFKNWGKTPAEIVSFDQKPSFFDNLEEAIPETPKYPSEGTVWAHTRMVPAGETWRDSGTNYWFAESFLPDDIWTDIRKSKRRLVFWGRLQYRDLIEYPASMHTWKKPNTIHETRFCYFWSPARNEFLICGPLGYNQHT